MNLLLLAPDIWEVTLLMSRVEKGRDPIKLSDLQLIAAKPICRCQHRLWSARKPNQGAWAQRGAGTSARSLKDLIAFNEQHSPVNILGQPPIQLGQTVDSELGQMEHVAAGESKS